MPKITSDPLPDYVAETVKYVTGKTWEELGDNVVFTVGDTIHSKIDIPEYLMVHELVHVKQQGDNPREWWEDYKSPDFRYSQELEAYRAEYQYLKKLDRNYAIKAAREFSEHLGGEMYGGCVMGYKAFLDITK